MRKYISYESALIYLSHLVDPNLLPDFVKHRLQLSHQVGHMASLIGRVLPHEGEVHLVSHRLFRHFNLLQHPGLSKIKMSLSMSESVLYVGILYCLYLELKVEVNLLLIREGGLDFVKLPLEFLEPRHLLGSNLENLLVVVVHFEQHEKHLLVHLDGVEGSADAQGVGKQLLLICAKAKIWASCKS